MRSKRLCSAILTALPPPMREMVVDRATAIGVAPIALDDIKIIVLMVLWSQGKEPDALMFDDLFGDDDEQEPRLLH